jgi:hypothetical protein
MPSSRPNAIPTVIGVVMELKPCSILDVGVGFGKWGHLFREYTDIIASESNPSRYRKENWRVRIDGIEGFANYLTPMHEYIYDKVEVGDAIEVLPRMGRYDLIFLGDVIEHFEKEEGRRLLTLALSHAEKALMITTPRYETPQGSSCGNELERHRSCWTAADFLKYEGASVASLDGNILLAVITKPDVPAPKMMAPRGVGPFVAFVGRTLHRMLGEKAFNQLRGRGLV